MEQKGNNKTGPLSGGKPRPTELVVKTGRNEVKPPISPSSDLGIFSGSAEEDGRGKESKRESDAEYLYGVDLFTEGHVGVE
jgi:hypothetical protein